MTTSIACTYPNVINTVANSFKALSGNSALTPERFIECLKVIINADLHTVLGDEANIVVTVTSKGNSNYVTHVIASDNVDNVNAIINHTRNVGDMPRKVFAFIPEARPQLINQIYTIVEKSFNGAYELDDVGADFVERIQRHIRIHVGLLVKDATVIKVNVVWAGSVYAVEVQVYAEEEPIVVNVQFERQTNVS